jgi:hypothetical protein
MTGQNETIASHSPAERAGGYADTYRIELRPRAQICDRSGFAVIERERALSYELCSPQRSGASHLSPNSVTAKPVPHETPRSLKQCRRRSPDEDSLYSLLHRLHHLRRLQQQRASWRSSCLPLSWVLPVLALQSQPFPLSTTDGVDKRHT